MSVQEDAYLRLPELWPRKCQPGVLHVNCNILNGRIILLKSQKELLEMPENNTDIAAKHTKYSF